MKTNTLHSSLRPFGWCVVLLSLVLVGCGVSQQRPAASNTQIGAAANEISSTRTVSRRSISINDAQNKISSILRRVRPSAEEQCLELGERASRRCDDWLVRVADVDDVNAAASGRQEIVLSRGIFEVARTDDEIAFVMAHEMGHHMLNHITETRVSAGTGRVLGAIAGGIIAYGLASMLGLQCDPVYQDCSYLEGFIRPVVEGGSDTGSYIGQRTFSRAQEHEADLIASYIVDSSGYDLQRARNFMVQLARINPNANQNSSFGDTHPSGPERLAQFDLSMSEVTGTSGQQSRVANTTVGDCISGSCVNGYGTYIWPNGQKYLGEWRDSLMHGQGTMTLAGGDKYAGEWRDSLMHGQGTYTWFNGGEYVGEWRDSKKNGRGTQTYFDGATYIGEWGDGKRNGQGTMTYVDGAKYVGEWEDEARREGTWTAADGSVVRGRWENDRFLGNP